MLPLLRSLGGDLICWWFGHRDHEIEDGLFTRVVCRACGRVRVRGNA